MHFGFSYVGLIYLVLLMVPNLVWAKNKPANYDEYVKNENKVLLIFERVGEVLVSTLALIFSDFNLRPWSAWSLFLAASFVLMILYELYWIRYFRSDKTMADQYRSFCFVPLAGATLPVIAFFLLGIYGKNPILMIAVIILGIGHIGIHLGHAKEVAAERTEEPPKTRKNPIKWIKKKTEPQRDFLRMGRPGALIGLGVLATQFISWMIYEEAIGKIPVVLAFFLTAAICVLIAELLNLFVRLLFGGGKRIRAYFLATFVAVFANNTIAQQGNAIPAAVLISFLITLAVDILGRCLWAFVRTGRFKQVFGYVAATLSLAWILLYGIFFRLDIWGESRVSFYNGIKDHNAVTTSQVSGFDAYLQEGAYPVATFSYGPEAENDIITKPLDYSGFDSVQGRGGMDSVTDFFSDFDFAQTPVKGQIWYPEGLSKCPALFIVHGAHDSAVPSYLGYEYLGKYLASNGYVVVSVDENIINELGEGNDKRAILLLDNMKTILEENEKEESRIRDLINPEKIAIAGHSRGGEMVATAYLFNDLEAYPEDGNVKFDYHFNISSIVAIAPVVDQYRPASHSVNIQDVNYLLIHGSNDQDVSDMMGEKQYNNVTFTKGRGERFFKTEVYILGANHGQFNSLWGRYDMTDGTNGFLNTNHFLAESEQKEIAKAYIRTFLDGTIGISDTYLSLMEDTAGYENYLPDTVYITNYRDSDYVSLCSFDDTVNIVSPEEGVSIQASGNATWKIEPYVRGDGREGEDYVLSLAWEETQSPEITFEFAPIDLSKGMLSFGIADMREDTAEMDEPLDYTVTLTDAAGHSIRLHNPKTIYHSLAVQLYKLDVFFDSYEIKHQLQTITIRPSDIASAEAEGFDLTQVTALSISTDGTDKGELILNEVSYRP